MTQKIARAILYSACLMLILGGLTAYFVVRRALLAELDGTLIDRASIVLRDAGVSAAAADPFVPPGDRYMIRNDQGQTIARPTAVQLSRPAPRVVSRGFADTADSGRLRTLTLRWDSDAPSGGATVVYSSSAAKFDAAVRNLVLALLASTIAGIAVTTVVARRVARSATRPLAQTADAIGDIDEQRLERRIDASALPPEMQPVAEKLNQMLSRLEAAFQQRRQFMTDVAHELRTPVAALRTTVEVALQRTAPDLASMTRSLERSLTAVSILESLVTGLSESLDEAHEPSTGCTFNSAEVIGESVELLAAQAQSKQISLDTSGVIAENLAFPVVRLRSIVINLLANAIEYTPSGGRVEVEACSQAGQWVLRVRDNGVGISTDNLERVFEPFFRVDKARSRGLGHLGLGLFIVRSHARAMGGTCSVRSQAQQGAEFTVALPVLQARVATRNAPGGSVRQPMPTASC